jgi:large subunit ribosomal protein L29
VKVKELRIKSGEELEEQLTQLRREMLNLRFQKETEEFRNKARFKSIRKDIARILTILHERELGLERDGETNE